MAIPADAIKSDITVYPPRGQAWLSTIIIFVITVIAMADRMAISMLIGPIKADFGIGDFQASLLVGLAFTIFYIIFLLPIGWAADRFSRRKVLAACLLVWSIATISCGFAGGFVILFVFRMLVGAGEAGLAPGAQGIIGSSFPREALTKPLALHGIGVQIGAAVGVAAAGAILTAGATGSFSGLPIIGEIAPWRISFILIGLPGIAALALIPLLHDPKEKVAGSSAQDKQAAEPFMPFLRQNKVLITLLLFASGFSAMGLGGVIGWAPEYLQRVLNASPMEAGAAMGATLLGAALLGQGIYSIIVDFCASRGMLDAPIRIGFIPIAISIPVAWISYSMDTEQGYLLWLFIFLLCITPCNALANTVMQSIAPPQFRSRLSAILILVISIIGFTLGPALVGLLSEYVVGEANLGVALQWVSTGAMIITLILLILLRPRVVAYLDKELLP